MSNFDKRALRKAAMHAKTTDDWGCDADNFHDKATPDAVLALLDEMEAKDKQIDDLKATAAHSNAGWKEAHEQEARAEAAEKRIAELERKEQHSERQSVIDALAGSGEEWSDIEEYMQKWDAERASAAGKGE
ncbi:ead/Ea22-like family protein [Enterobacter roggenkampii]|uniref:ead/Ea22-like family protein n=1 Tax=Enterobacter roggenkampii TaxID=1812935 RepID=UPI002FF6A905